MKVLLKTASAAALVLMSVQFAMADAVVHVLRAETTNDEKAFNEKVGADYAASHAGTTVQFEYLANEAYKQKLATLLQSDNRPDLFYSWGGGVLADQAKAGYLQDITAQMTGDWASKLSPAAVNAFTIDGKVYGAPLNASDVSFWVNNKLAKQAGVDVTTIKTWSDFLAAVSTIKAAGITPIIVGGKDKWPLHFYYGYLAVREAGEQGFADAMAGNGEGFAAPSFVKAGVDFKQLVDLSPFQPGFMDTGYEQATGMFGDGKGVFHLMGDWDYGASRQNSADGKGVPDADLALMRFPAVDGGAGAATDTFGGINGWAVAAGAKPEAVDFLKYFTGPEVQTEAAAQGFFIPVAIGADKGLTNPYFGQISAALGQSNFHQIFLDQSLGADVGATFNDMSADLAQGNTSPEDAALAIQDAWANR